MTEIYSSEIFQLPLTAIKGAVPPSSPPWTLPFDPERCEAVIVSSQDGDGFTLVNGNNRVAAAKAAGCESIAAIIIYSRPNPAAQPKLVNEYAPRQ